MIPERFQPVLDGIRPLADAFNDAGHRLYLVGGVVRDLFLSGSSGRVIEPTDLDFTTDAEPDQIETILRNFDGVEALWTQGKRFGTIGCRIAIGGRSIDHEITTHRAEAYTPDSRKPDVVYATDVEADLSRRDFTVNAMALSLPDATLVDPFDGMTDLLVHKALRTPLSPEESFGDDPLRMLRAARFLNRYDLTPDPDLVLAVEKMAGRLEIVSAERIRDELCRLVVLDDCSAGLWFLCDTGLAHEFFPELPEMRVEQDPIHRHKDVLAHTIAVVNNTSPELVLRLSALFHDIGKPATRAIGAHGVSFHHHEVVGARMTRKRMKALKFSNEMIDDVSKLVFLHLRFHGYGDDAWTDAAVRRYVRDAGDLLPRLNELTRCDCTTRNKRKAEMLSRRMDRLEERIARLEEEEELKSIRPDIDGARVMELLEISPSRVVGEALDMLLEARMEEGPLGEEEAERRLLEWWAARQTD